MELLGKIFGSRDRVKIMRLFLFNPMVPFDSADISTRSRVDAQNLRKEITTLVKIGFLKKKTFIKKTIVPATKKKPATTKKNKKEGWMLDTRFELIKPLRALLLDSELINEKDMVKRIKKSGSIKLALLSGIFIDDENRKLDVLIVGEKIKKNILEKEIAIIESEIGRELAYTFFDTSEFKYRMSMYDKLIRDVLENPHRKIINTLLN